VSKRIPQIKPSNTGRIRPHDAPDISPQQMRPKFSFEHLRNGYCILDCTAEQKAAFADRLRELSQLTWQQIQNSPRHGQGCEIIDRSSIREPIPANITDDVKIIAFRCIGKAPMVGYRADEVFFVVWIDRCFSLYNHG